LDNSGNVIVTGYFTSPSVNAGGTILNLTGKQDVFLMKFSGSGDLTWAKSFGESDRLFELPRVKSDADDNLYLIFSEGYAYSRLMVFNADGQILNNITQKDVRFTDLEISGSDMYLAGTDEADFGSGQTFHDACLVKTDLLGNLKWLIYGTAEDSKGTSNVVDISVGSDGSIYLLGTLNKYAVWGDITLTDLGFVVFITKVNPDAGQIYWTKRLEVSNNTYKPFMQLTMDETDNLFLSGYTGVSASFGSVNIDPGNFILKCNSAGTGLWSENLDFKPIGICYRSGRIIASGYDQYWNMIVSRYSSDAALEYSTDFRSNSGTGTISGMEADSAANLYSYGTLTGNGEIFGTNYQNFKGCFLSKHNSRGEPLWIKLIEGGQAGTYTFGNSFVLNRKNNCLYMIGNVIDTLETDAGNLLKTDADQFLAKYSTDGTCEWVKPLKGFDIYAADVTSDGAGNVILSGGDIGNVTIGDTSLTGVTHKTAYVAKFDINGTRKWAFKISNTNMIYIAITSTDKNNMIYFTGEFHAGTINFNGTNFNTNNTSEGNVLYAKMDPNGNLLWVKTFGRSTKWRYYSWPVNMVTDPQGYSYMSGWHGDSIYFDDHLLTRPYNDPDKFRFNFFVAKINPSGNIEWIKSIFEENYDYNYNEFELDDMGNCYMIAKFTDTIYFENDYTVPNIGTGDLFIAKYLPDGDIHWVKTIESSTGTNWIQGLAVIDSLSLFTGGYFSRDLFFDAITLQSYNSNGFIALLSQDRLNCMQVSGTFSDYVCPGKNDGYIDISVTGGNPPFTYSWSNGETTEDLQDLSSGQYDVTVIDNKSCIVNRSFILDSVMPYEVAELCDEETIGMIVKPSDQQLTIYPNPFKDRTIIEFSNPGNTSWRLVITDLAGKVVRTESNITSGEYEMDRGNLVPGTYIIEIRGENVYRGKLVVE